MKKSRQKRRFRPIPRQFALQFQCLAGKFPETQRTGIFFAGTGNFLAGTGNFSMEQGIPLRRSGFHGKDLWPCAERLWRLSLAREHLRSEIGKPSLHGRIGQRLNYRRIEFADDIPRRAFGREKRAPGIEGNRQSYLDKRRDVGANARRVSPDLFASLRSQGRSGNLRVDTTSPFSGPVAPRV